MIFFVRIELNVYLLLALFHSLKHVAAMDPVRTANGDCGEDLLRSPWPPGDGADPCGHRVVRKVVAHTCVHSVRGEAHAEYEQDDPEIPRRPRVRVP